MVSGVETRVSGNQRTAASTQFIASTSISKKVLWAIRAGCAAQLVCSHACCLEERMTLCYRQPCGRRARPRLNAIIQSNGAEIAGGHAPRSQSSRRSSTRARENGGCSGC